jgi:hypothetical protein
MRSRLFRLAGTTIRRTVSKFVRESASFHVVLPAGSGWSRMPVAPA